VDRAAEALLKVSVAEPNDIIGRRAADVLVIDRNVIVIGCRF
jgi:hypothetical protein